MVERPAGTTAQDKHDAMVLLFLSTQGKQTDRKIRWIAYDSLGNIITMDSAMMAVQRVITEEDAMDAEVTQRFFDWQELPQSPRQTRMIPVMTKSHPG